jgi:hypothetical protein
MQISTKTGVVQAILSSSPNSENIETPLAASQVPGEIANVGVPAKRAPGHVYGAAMVCAFVNKASAIRMLAMSISLPSRATAPFPSFAA